MNRKKTVKLTLGQVDSIASTFVEKYVASAISAERWERSAHRYAQRIASGYVPPSWPKKIPREIAQEYADHFVAASAHKFAKDAREGAERAAKIVLTLYGDDPFEAVADMASRLSQYRFHHKAEAA